MCAASQPRCGGLGNGPADSLSAPGGYAGGDAGQSADLDHYARVFSEALGRTIRYRDAPTSEWREKLRAAGLSEHVVRHLTVMTELHKQGRYDRMSEDYRKLTGETPTSMADFVKLHAAEFTRPSRFGAGP